MHHVVIILVDISTSCSPPNFIPLREQVQLEVLIVRDSNQLSKHVELFGDSNLLQSVFGLFTTDFSGVLISFSLGDFDGFNFFVSLAVQLPGDGQWCAVY